MLKEMACTTTIPVVTKGHALHGEHQAVVVTCIFTLGQRAKQLTACKIDDVNPLKSVPSPPT